MCMKIACLRCPINDSDMQEYRKKHLSRSTLPHQCLRSVNPHKVHARNHGNPQTNANVQNGVEGLSPVGVSTYVYHAILKRRLTFSSSVCSHCSHSASSSSPATIDRQQILHRSAALPFPLKTCVAQALRHHWLRKTAVRILLRQRTNRAMHAGPPVRRRAFALKSFSDSRSGCAAPPTAHARR